MRGWQHCWSGEGSCLNSAKCLSVGYQLLSSLVLKFRDQFVDILHSQIAMQRLVVLA